MWVAFPKKINQRSFLLMKALTVFEMTDNCELVIDKDVECSCCYQCLFLFNLICLQKSFKHDQLAYSANLMISLNLKFLGLYVGALTDE